MNALVIGYGSIGKRHKQVLENIGLHVSIVSRRSQPNIKCYNSIKEAITNASFDYIVIANETSAHLNSLKEIIQNDFKGKVLVEKPLFSNYEELEKGFNNVYVAYNLRFHPLIHQLKTLLIDEEITSVNAYVGQYLPTWRPDSDYTKGYSAFSEQGGGVLRDLSHELDYLMLLFGEWESLVSNASKISNLNIKSEDYVQITYITKNNIQIAVELNYLDRIMQRYMIIQTNNKTIKVDFISNLINCNGEITQFAPLERNHTYQIQHEDVLKSAEICCTFAEGLMVMKMIEAVEKSSQLKEWIYND